MLVASAAAAPALAGMVDIVSKSRAKEGGPIVDTFSRYSPAVEPRFSFCGADVVKILEDVGRQLGFPKAIRVDQGTEFVSRDLDLWAYQRGVTLDFSRPGKPTDNAFIESFNGKFRAECLNAHRFMSLDDAQRKCEAWRR